jgi:hypothetical protein
MTTCRTMIANNIISQEEYGSPVLNGSVEN